MNGEARATESMTGGPHDGPQQEPTARLSQKEFAKKMRRQAYARAKEFRKTDPRQIVMMDKLKQQRRDAYQKVKERGKALKVERKQAADEKAAEVRIAKGKGLMAMLVPASTLKSAAKRRPSD